MAQQMLTVMAEAAAQQHGTSPTSQPQQHATPRVKVKGRRRVKSRTSYSLSLKLKAVEEAERSGLRAAALNLDIDERVLRQWLTKAEELRQAGLTNAGSTRRLRSRSASKIASGVSSSPEHEVHSTVSPAAIYFISCLLFNLTKSVFLLYFLTGCGSKSSAASTVDSQQRDGWKSERDSIGCDTTQCRIAGQRCGGP
jgi:transposase-like protein